VIDPKAYYNKLPPKYKEIYDEIFERIENDKKKLIKKEIEIDHNHLNIVNLCANPFLIHAQMNKQTGFEIRCYDPLHETNKKNWDVALYRPSSEQLILLECKSSLSNLKKIDEEIMASIKVAENNIETLEKAVSGDINDIEYTYCLPSNDGIDLGNYAFKKDLPICVWCYDAMKSEIKLFQYPEENNEDGFKNGHLHKNHTLTRHLSNGIFSTYKLSRSSSFLPSSHMYTMLIDVTINIVRKMSHFNEWDGDFEFSDVYQMINKNLAIPNSLKNEDITTKTINLIKKGIEKELYTDETNSIKDFKNKKYKIYKGIIEIENSKKIVEDNYININAKHMAENNIVNEFKKETGYRDIDDYND